MEDVKIQSVCNFCKSNKCNKCKSKVKKRNGITIINYSQYVYNGFKHAYKDFDYVIQSDKENRVI